MSGQRSRQYGCPEIPLCSHMSKFYICAECHLPQHQDSPTPWLEISGVYNLLAAFLPYLSSRPVCSNYNSPLFVSCALAVTHKEQGNMCMRHGEYLVSSIKDPPQTFCSSTQIPKIAAFTKPKDDAWAYVQKSWHCLTMACLLAFALHHGKIDLAAQIVWASRSIETLSFRYVCRLLEPRAEAIKQNEARFLCRIGMTPRLCALWSYWN